MITNEQIKSRVVQEYTRMIEASSACCGPGDCCTAPDADAIYPIELLDKIPAGVVSFGCGNPVALASLRRGETVLDLGSGAGLDCFLASQQVGPEGSVIGVDFAQAMVDRATEKATQLGLTNVEFRLGDIETLPLDDASVDVIISNCVINLAPDKDAVFREAHRALRSGGRLMVSDIVLTRPATEAEKDDMALLTGCISGSLPATEYAGKIRDAGFEDIELDADDGAQENHFWYSAAISATKP